MSNIYNRIEHKFYNLYKVLFSKSSRLHKCLNIKQLEHTKIRVEITYSGILGKLCSIPLVAHVMLHMLNIMPYVIGLVCDHDDLNQRPLVMLGLLAQYFLRIRLFKHILVS